MSVGGFTSAKYEDDEGNISNITVQPETLLLTIDGIQNSEAAGAVNSSQSINVSGGRKQKGVNARKIRVRVLTAGTSGLKVGSVIALPWLQSSTFLDATRPGRKTGTYYLGSTVQVVGGSAEDFVTR